MLRNARRASLLIVALLVAGSAASASELVRFVDGRYLRVESHRTAGSVMRLDLPGSSFLVIPAERVDVIRRAGRVVYNSEDFAEARKDAFGPTGSTVEPVLAGRTPDRRGPWDRDRPAPGALLAGWAERRH